MIDKIISRRSIRKYTDKNVSKKDINEIIKAAMYAPSAMNQQAWHFIIIDDHNILDKVPDFHQGGSFITGAKLGILVCADKKIATRENYLAVDCSVATQNLLLAAHAKDLGACWIGIYPKEDRMGALKNMLNLPDSILPFSLIALGYPNEVITTDERFKPERIHLNKW